MTCGFEKGFSIKECITPRIGILRDAAASSAPVTGRYTRYGTLHPIRTGALPTDRVHHPHSQAQPRTTAPRAPTSAQRQQAKHNETTAAPARAANNNPCHAMLSSYRIAGSPPFESNPPIGHERRLGSTPPNPSPQPPVVAHRKPQKIDSPRQT